MTIRTSTPAHQHAADKPTIHWLKPLLIRHARRACQISRSDWLQRDVGGGQFVVMLLASIAFLVLLPLLGG